MALNGHPSNGPSSEQATSIRPAIERKNTRPYLLQDREEPDFACIHSHAPVILPDNGASIVLTCATRPLKKLIGRHPWILVSLLMCLVPATVMAGQLYAVQHGSSQVHTIDIAAGEAILVNPVPLTDLAGISYFPPVSVSYFGASSINVGGNLYDVVFLDGTCIALFVGCDARPAGFTSISIRDALAASQTLLDQVLMDGGASQFDSSPGVTSGFTDHDQCGIFAPCNMSRSSVLWAKSQNWNPIESFRLRLVGIGTAPNRHSARDAPV